MMAAAALERAQLSERFIARAGTWGAALTLAIVGASVLVRLAARIEAGEAISSLPQAVELSVRIAHRIAATGVAVAAAFALVGVAGARPLVARRAMAVAAILGLTLLLATIGRYTTGYRLAGITVANVLAGTLLACAFWWLRQDCRVARAPAASPGVAWAALGALLLVSGLGAASNALAMHGAHGLGAAHLWMATLFLVLALWAAWRDRARRALATAVAALAAFDYLMGIDALNRASSGTGLALPWTHAMAAAVLAPLLLSLARPGAVPQTPELRR